jgi:DNA-binding MarR family transcriptional regulator
MQYVHYARRGDEGLMMTAVEQVKVDLATGLIRLARLVQEVFAQVSGRYGLTAAQARLLCILTEGPRGMGELAGLLGVEKAAITGLVDRVVQRDLVERTPVPGDRRALRARLTLAGEQVAVTVHGEVCAQLEGLASELPPPDREHFRRSVARMTSPGSRQA